MRKFSVVLTLMFMVAITKLAYSQGNYADPQVSINGTVQNLSAWIGSIKTSLDTIKNVSVSMCQINNNYSCKLYQTTTITDDKGFWSITFPNNMFSSTIQTYTSVISKDLTATNAIYVTQTASSLSGITGAVFVPNSIVVGGIPVKSAGAGITVNVMAIGY